MTTMTVTVPSDHTGDRKPAGRRPADKKPDLLAVLERAGLDLSNLDQYKKSVSLRCPFHEDKGRPNFVLWHESGRWQCFRCGIGGDVYDFVGHQLYGNAWNCRDTTMFGAVAERLKVDDIPLVTLVAPETPKQRELALAVVHVLGYAANVYNLSLIQNPSAEFARTYLASRKIDLATIRRMKLGYVVPGALAGALAGYPPKLRLAALEAGLFFSEKLDQYPASMEERLAALKRGEFNESREFLKGRITFPDLGPGGKVLGMVGRSTTKDASYRYLSLPGLPKTIYRLEAASKNRVVVLTESLVDTVNLWQMQFQGAGANGTGIAAYLIAKLNTYPFIAILPQNDDAGREAVERWNTLIPHARLLSIPYRSGDQYEKDVNDMFKNRGPEETRAVISEALAKAGYLEQ